MANCDTGVVVDPTLADGGGTPVKTGTADVAFASTATIPAASPALAAMTSFSPAQQPSPAVAASGGPPHTATTRRTPVARRTAATRAPLTGSPAAFNTFAASPVMQAPRAVDTSPPRFGRHASTHDMIRMQRAASKTSLANGSRSASRMGGSMALGSTDDLVSAAAALDPAPTEELPPQSSEALAFGRAKRVVIAGHGATRLNSRVAPISGSGIAFYSCTSGGASGTGSSRGDTPSKPAPPRTGLGLASFGLTSGGGRASSPSGQRVTVNPIPIVSTTMVAVLARGVSHETAVAALCDNPTGFPIVDASNVDPAAKAISGVVCVPPSTVDNNDNTNIDAAGGNNKQTAEGASVQVHLILIPAARATHAGIFCNASWALFLYAPDVRGSFDDAKAAIEVHETVSARTIRSPTQRAVLAVSLDPAKQKQLFSVSRRVGFLGDRTISRDSAAFAGEEDASAAPTTCHQEAHKTKTTIGHLPPSLRRWDTTLPAPEPEPEPPKNHHRATGTTHSSSRHSGSASGTAGMKQPQPQQAEDEAAAVAEKESFGGAPHDPVPVASPVDGSLGAPGGNAASDAAIGGVHSPTVPSLLDASLTEHPSPSGGAAFELEPEQQQPQHQTTMVASGDQLAEVAEQFPGLAFVADTAALAPAESILATAAGLMLLALRRGEPVLCHRLDEGLEAASDAMQEPCMPARCAVM